MGLEPEWTVYSGQKVQPKYGSGAGSRSRVDPQNWPHFGTHMVIKTLDGSSCKKNVKLVP